MNQADAQIAQRSSQAASFFLTEPFSLSSASLKAIACLTMLIDHVGFLFFPDQLLWRVVGRISFPIFAFLVAEGFEKTRSVQKYFSRLLAFAAISQIPYWLFRFGADKDFSDLNIFFTLSAGLIALSLWKHLSLRYAIPAVTLIAVMSHLLHFDYGAYGVGTVLASQIILHRQKIGWAALLLLPQIPVAIRFLLGALSIQTFAAVSVPIIAAYNGERGAPIPRFVFYWFYPLHLVLLWLIWVVVV